MPRTISSNDRLPSGPTIANFDFRQQPEIQARPALRLARDEIQIHCVT